MSPNVFSARDAEHLPSPVQHRPRQHSRLLTKYNTCNYILLCSLNIAQFSIKQLEPTSALKWISIGIDIAWLPLTGLMFLINFIHRGHDRYTSYIVLIACVALLSFVQNEGFVPLRDLPFVVDIGLALGWSLSRQTFTDTTLGQRLVDCALAASMHQRNSSNNNQSNTFELESTACPRYRLRRQATA